MKRYYIIRDYEIKDDKFSAPSATDQEFINEAERQGTVYSQEGFQEAFNNQDINTASDFLRIIEINDYD